MSSLFPKEERMVDTMCNLSVGVFRRGYHSGIEQGIERGVISQKKKMIIQMLRKKAGLDFITSVSDCTEEYVKQIAEEEHIAI